MKWASGGGATTSTEVSAYVPLVYHDSGAVGCRRYLVRAFADDESSRTAPRVHPSPIQFLSDPRESSCSQEK